MGLETAIIGSAVLGTAGGMFGQDQAQKAQKKGAKKLESYVGSYEQSQLGNIEQGFGEQERLMKQANREELQGGEDAIKRFEGFGTQAIEDQSAQAKGQISAGLSSRGLLGSSVEGNMRLGAGRAASRSYMSLGESVSSMRQNLAARTAAATNRMGALKAYKAQAKNNVLANSLNLLGGYQANQTYTSQAPDFSGIGMGLGLMAGMGGGTKQPVQMAPNQMQFAQQGLGNYGSWI